MLTARAKFEIAATLLALLAMGAIAWSWISAREDAIKLKATLEAQGQVITAAQKQVKDLQAAEAERDKQAAATVANLQSAAAKQVTPAQIAAWISKQLQLPQPITVTVPSVSPQNPSPNATASIPAADLPALRDTIEKCQECSVKLSTAQADLSSRDQQAILAQKQIDALKTERDAAVTAAKGGSKWQRLKKAGKWTGIGILVGAGALCGSGHCK